MDVCYDLVVIGAGAAGLSAAAFAARLRARVALIERGRIGGDCTWSGCVPSKALRKAAKLAQEMRRADAFGLPRVEPQVDLRRVVAWVRVAIEGVSRFETPEALAEDGIELVFGAARFLDPHTVDVGGRLVRGRYIVICTGAAPALPAVPGLPETSYLTYRDVLDLPVLPARLLVLGAGPIGLELAQAFQRLGSAVTVLEQAQRVLPQADSDASAALATRLAEEGVDLRTGVGVERVERAGSGVAAAAAGQTWVSDALLVTTGRRPVVAGLGLERAGVAYSGSGVKVDPRLRTSQRHIYACGDVIGAAQFTHYAAWQGAVAARNALLPGASRGIPRAVPWVVFTDPEIGQVGLSEDEARRRWSDVLVQRWPMERVDRARTEGDVLGLLKLVARGDGRLLGATVVASAGGELVNELAVALERRLALRDLALTMHAYPTYGAAIQQASFATMMTQLMGGWRGPLLRAAVRWRR